MVVVNNKDDCATGEANKAYQIFPTYYTDLPDDSKNLFAKVWRVKELNDASLEYTTEYSWETMPPSAGPWNVTQSARDYGSSSPLFPQVESTDNNVNKFNLIAQTAVAEGQFQSDSGGFEIKDNTLVTSKFYAYTNEDHMPIVGYWYDYGDGIGEGNYNTLMIQNHKKIGGCLKVCKDNNSSSQFNCEGCDIGSCTGSCVSGLCQWNDVIGAPADIDCSSNPATGCQWSLRPKDFGNSERACIEVPWELVHNYICDPSNILVTCPVDYSTNYESIPIGGCKIHEGEDDICVYRSRVYLRDNWNHCTGNQWGYHPSSSEISDSLNNCQPSNPSAWVKFDGYIKVIASFREHGATNPDPTTGMCEWML